jgi:hypothetical protein
VFDFIHFHISSVTLGQGDYLVLYDGLTRSATVSIAKLLSDRHFTVAFVYQIVINQLNVKLFVNQPLASFGSSTDLTVATDVYVCASQGSGVFIQFVSDSANQGSVHKNARVFSGR